MLKTSPNNAQAWLTRATILQLQAQYSEAARSCERLVPLAQEFVTVACTANVASMTGHAELSYQQLSDVLRQMPSGATETKAWIETSLAEIATRLDKRPIAEGHFKRALRAGEPDPYLKAAYADFLLDAARPAEVARLLAADTRVDNLLLRLALADLALGSAALADRIAALQARFGAARARGDSIHLREESRFYTALLKEPREGLRLAQANWAVQKEPADARVLLEAAFAADERASAQPVIDWIKGNGVQDIALERLVRKLAQE